MGGGSMGRTLQGAAGSLAAGGSRNEEVRRKTGGWGAGFWDGEKFKVGLRTSSAPHHRDLGQDAWDAEQSGTLV